MAAYRSIVILTGAGISAESGLGTFREEGGLWAKHRIEDVATPEGFARNPDLVQGFYNMRRQELKKARPNPAHKALAELEGQLDGKVTLVTQNVDNLHEQAGSQNILHMHGALAQVRCTACGAIHEDWLDDITSSTACPACRQKRLRPHIVWFGEIPFHMDEIEEALMAADLFLSIGTSGAVYPAAGFVQMIRGFGNARAVELNLEKSEGAHLFHEGRYGPASEIVPAFVAEILADQ